MIDITQERAELTDAKPDYTLVRDTLRGETHIKSKTTTYLLKTSGQAAAEREDPVAGKLLYDSYIYRAEFYDAMSSAYRAMIAMAHDSQPEIELPSGMNYLIEGGATDDGVSLEEFSKRVTREILTTGRCPILVDAPPEGGDPYLLCYRGEELINWMTDKRYVFELTKSIQSESGEITQEAYYLELLFTTQGDDENPAGYRQVVWTKEDTGQMIPSEPVYIPEMERIPLIVSGSVDITDDIDEIPLLPMAKATIAAYQMSADYRHAMFLAGQPTPYGTGVEAEEKPSLLGSASMLTARNPQARFGYMEVGGSGFAAMEKAISSKKAEADMYGIRVTGGGSGEAAETLKIRLMSQQATLKSAVKSAGEAIERALKFIAEWKGLNPDEVSYTPNMDFASVEVDTNVINAFNAAINAENLPKEMLWEYMRASGITEDDNDTIAAMISDGRPELEDLGENEQDSLTEE